MAEVRDDAPGPSEKLCLSCGLCCDGSLFARGEVDPRDIDRWSIRGLDCGTQGAKAYFKQSCDCLDETGCTLFETGRPSICERFRCIPLRRLEAGEQNLEEAQVPLREAIELRDGVIAAACDAGFACRNFLQLKDELAGAFVDPDSATDQGAVVFALTSLTTFNAFAENFLLPEDGRAD